MIGFSAEERLQLDRRAARLSLLETAPAISTHPGATIVEALPFTAHEAFGGVYDEGGNLIPLSQIVRGPGQRCFVGAAEGYTPVATREVDSEVVYGGFVIDHFGHFLLETFSRLWSTNLAAGGEPIVLQCPGGRLPPFAARMYELAGLGGAIRPLTESTRFRRVTVPGPAFVSRHSASTAFRELALRVTEAILGGKIPTASEQPLYLSRSKLSRSVRTLAGEEALEDVLRSNGFKIVHPERIDVAEQIRLINSHRHLFGPIGSAFHLMMFSQSITQAFCLTAGTPNPNYLLMDWLAGTNTTYIRTARAAPPFWDASFVEAGFPAMLDLEATLSALAELGFIRPGDAARVSHAPERDYRHRFLWRALEDAIGSGSPVVTRRSAALVREEFPEDEELNALVVRALSRCGDA